MAAGKYDKCVFVNCPFDEHYTPIFNAIIFAIFDCGFVPRCALEEQDAGEVRARKLQRIIQDCRLGLHDISRIELDRGTRLPRFNMPYELGVFLGAKCYGAGKQGRKICMILERKRFSYQKYISDIAGQDIKAHGNDSKEAVAIVRNWLSTTRGKGAISGPSKIWDRYCAFTKNLPQMARSADLRMKELTYADRVEFISAWLQGAVKQAQKASRGKNTLRPRRRP